MEDIYYGQKQRRETDSVLYWNAFLIIHSISMSASSRVLDFSGE
jgi:hypothetical protein